MKPRRDAMSSDAFRDKEAAHRTEIVGQFSRQAIPFAKVPGHLGAMDLLLEISGAGSEDSVLDVACGPGLLACEFARRAKAVTGLDITEAMLEQGRALPDGC